MGAAAIAGLPIEPVNGPVLCRTERRVRGRVRPRTAEEVAAVVAAAKEAGWRVHAVSSGKNWGLGSYLPRDHDRLLVDLAGLHAIGPLDRVAGTVRIEAGVTQRRLYDWLQREAPELAFNVTGSGAETSITGNALERGIGYDGSREDDVFGHEVVLPDGTWHRPDPAWFSPTGCTPAGPWIDALWSQNDGGIVTALWLRLRRRQEREAAVVINGSREAVFSVVREAYRQEVLRLPVHMAGNERAEVVSRGLLRNLWGRTPTAAEVGRIFPEVSGETAIGALRGTRGAMRAAVRDLKRIGAGRVRVRALTAKRLETGERWLRRLGRRDRADFIAAVRPLLALTWGEPSDAGLASIGSAAGENPDELKRGAIYFNAVSAVDLEQSLRVEQMIREAVSEVGITRLFRDRRTLIHIVTVIFKDGDRGDIEAVMKKLGGALRVAGFPPFRMGLIGGAEDYAERNRYLRAIIGRTQMIEGHQPIHG